MKIKLSDEVTVKCKPEKDIKDNLLLGCHLIACNLSKIVCSKSSCEIYKRGLSGLCYTIDRVEDILIED